MKLDPDSIDPDSTNQDKYDPATTDLDRKDSAQIRKGNPIQKYLTKNHITKTDIRNRNPIRKYTTEIDIRGKNPK